MQAKSAVRSPETTRSRVGSLRGSGPRGVKAGIPLGPESGKVNDRPASAFMEGSFLAA